MGDVSFLLEQARLSWLDPGVAGGDLAAVAGLRLAVTTRQVLPPPTGVGSREPRMSASSLTYTG